MFRRNGIIGGATLIGMGVGFLLQEYFPGAMTACMFLGIGIGMLISHSRKNLPDESHFH